MKKRCGEQTLLTVELLIGQYRAKLKGVTTNGDECSHVE